jgi:hypothetical protein
MSKQTSMEEYLKILTQKEDQPLKKAKEILNDSFNLEKSIGFLEWKHKMENERITLFVKV